MNEHDHQPPHPGNEPAATQWVSVPPEHPYAAGQRGPAGRGLAIASMALGLAALLTTIVAGIYAPVFVVLGALIGLAAVVIGIIAAVRRQRPRGAGFVGLGAGTLAVIAAAAVGALSLSVLLTPELPELGTGSEVAPGPAPEGNASAIEWPANMATGGIVFGPGLQPAPSDPLQPGTAPQPAEIGAAGERADVVIYLDYRCPYCMLFEEANGELLADAAESGDITVEVVPLNFLDRVSAGSEYSSRAAAAVACVVDQQPDRAWSAHAALLTASFQPAEGIPGPTDDELIAELDRATGGLDRGAQSCITERRFVPFVKALNDWVFANPIPNARQSDQRVSGTPTVLVNGVTYTGDPADGASFRAFFSEQTQ